jgi:GAF domain-containing protein
LSEGDGGPEYHGYRFLIRMIGVAMASEHIGELKKWVSELSRRNSEGESITLNHAVELISKNFAVQTHEVAILGLTPDERSLRFLTPQSHRAVGQIPLSSTTSLAARTVREKRPELINHFTVVPHASVFEAVPIADEQRGDPIQKIMSSPIVLDNQVIGVVQVSRKGKAQADSGPDFTHPQLRELKTISDTLAPCISLCNKH